MAIRTIGWSLSDTEDDSHGGAAVPDGNGGVQAEAAVDVWALSRNGAVQNAAWYAKPFVAAREVGKRAALLSVDWNIRVVAGSDEDRRPQTPLGSSISMRHICA